MGIDELFRTHRGWVVAAAALVAVLACWLLPLVRGVDMNTAAALGLVLLVVLIASTQVVRPGREQLEVDAMLADRVGAAVVVVAAHRDA